MATINNNEAFSLPSADSAHTDPYLQYLQQLSVLRGMVPVPQWVGAAGGGSSIPTVGQLWPRGQKAG